MLHYFDIFLYSPFFPFQVRVLECVCLCTCVRARALAFELACYKCAYVIFFPLLGGPICVATGGVDLIAVYFGGRHHSLAHHGPQVSHSYK